MLGLLAYRNLNWLVVPTRVGGMEPPFSAETLAEERD